MESGPMAGRQATAQVNLDAVAHNLKLVQELTSRAQEQAQRCRIMAIVKANAYGHGAAEVASCLGDADSDALGVARINEAVELRDAGISQPICLLEGVANREELNLASVYELDIVVHDFHQLELLRAGSAQRRIWLKFDTGMGRLGFHPDDAERVADNINGQTILGLMTHLANADCPRDKRNDVQLALMQRLVKSLAPSLRDMPLSAANSAAILALPASHHDWVRPGLMLYGANPMADAAPDTRLLPAMTLSAPIIAVKPLRKGDQVGYGGLWQASKDTRIAVVAAGYADGYPREINAAPVLIAGERRQLVGQVSMDMLCVELEPQDKVNPGDRTILWGEGLPIEDIAKAAGTLPYTLMCGVAPRVNRVYRGGVSK